MLIAVVRSVVFHRARVGAEVQDVIAEAVKSEEVSVRLQFPPIRPSSNGVT